MILPPKNFTNLKWALYKESPGTAGCFLKAYDTINGIKHYYKMSSFDSVRKVYGHECLNEIVARNIAEKIGLPFLDYKLQFGTVCVNGSEFDTYFTDSVNFCKNNETKIALEHFYELKSNQGEDIIDFLKRYNFWEDVQKMMVFDFLICNRDRHGANIEIINSKESHRLAPFFDNGLSFFCSCLNNPEQIQNHKTNINATVNNYIGTTSLLDNLGLVDFDILKAISEVEIGPKDLLNGLENVNLPYIKEYKDKIIEVFAERMTYLRDYVRQKDSERNTL